MFDMDKILYGCSIKKDGKRVDPRKFGIYQLSEETKTKKDQLIKDLEEYLTNK